jgi:hypothetical protein
LLRLDDMAHTENIERAREEREPGRDEESGVGPEGGEVGRNEDAKPEGRGLGNGAEGLLEVVRAGLEPGAGAAGQALTAEGRVRDDVLLRRLRDFICGASLKQGWRG